MSSSVASGASSPRWRLARPLFSFWMVLPMMEGSLSRSGQLRRASLEGHRTRLWENGNGGGQECGEHKKRNCVGLQRATAVGAQTKPSKAQTKVLLAPSPEPHSPLGVLQEQICFGLLREGLGGTETFQEHNTGLCLVKAVGWEHQESLSCS